MTAIDPDIDKRIRQLFSNYPPTMTDTAMFLGARFDAGLAWVHYPEECGGLGADPDQFGLVTKLFAEAGAPTNFSRNPIALGMVGPTIARHGTVAQQRRYLRPMYVGDEIWCQMFSEPGAGSDLASLATSAVPDGDGWVVNGQKVWTSLGHEASHGLLLARTDINAPKNRGLTMFVVDMATPGIDVRPLRQMTGNSEFNEIYLDDARLPFDASLGPIDKGWQIATTTLMNERVSIGNSLADTLDQPLTQVLELYKDVRQPKGLQRDRVAKLWIEGEVVRLTSARAAQLGRTGDPGPAGSVGKLLAAEHAVRIHELAVDLLGAEGMLYPPTDADGAPVEHGPQVSFLRSRANTIEGGTSEIMRNILAERILGLPRDEFGPRHMPWRELRRN